MTQRTQSLDIRRAPEAGGSFHPDVDTVIAHQSLDLKIKAAVCPFPAPEKVFAGWLLRVPRSVNLCAGARKQIAFIDRCASRHPDVQFLRTLLAAVAGDCAWRKPFTNL
jgi:hypothetical protein